MSGNSVSPEFLATGSLSATGSTETWGLSGPFNITISGTWVGSWALEASNNGGATWVNCVLPDGTPNAFSGNGLYVVPNVFQRGMLFRITFTRTSGTLAWAVSL